jgi:hypothetical protein
MLIQPCIKCGAMLNEDAPKYVVTLKAQGCQTHGTVCQRCYGMVENDNDNSKLLNG